MCSGHIKLPLTVVLYDCEGCQVHLSASILDIFYFLLLLFYILLSCMTWVFVPFCCEGCQVHLSVSVLDIFDYLLLLFYYDSSGMTWIFAFVTVRDARFIFQCLFCIFCSLQGLLIFIFHVASGRKDLNFTFYPGYR